MARLFSSTFFVLVLSITSSVLAAPSSASHRSSSKSTTLAPLRPADDPIPNKFIVMLKDSVEPTTVTSHYMWLGRLMALKENESGSSDVVVDQVEKTFNLADRVYGYSGMFTPETLSAIRRNPQVAYVEPDQIVSIGKHKIHSQSQTPLQQHWRTSSSSRKAKFRNFNKRPKDNKQTTSYERQSDAPWGLSRISHIENPALDPETESEYIYDPASGTSVTVYVIDTGINIAHNDFEGRAKWGITIPENDPDEDGNGHGTHCAGTIAGRKYGVAKNATVVAVKVLRSSGAGTLSDVAKGVEWVVEEHQRRELEALREGGKKKKKTTVKSVANMSLGGGKSDFLDKVVDAAVDAGVHFAVAAGNSGDDS
ncbi:serine protease, partial [Chytridiales sp. JEL 0842]